MANRDFKPFQGAIEAGIVKLFGKVTTGAAGAIASQISKGHTVTHSGVGAYTVTLQDTYYDLRGLSVTLIGPAGATAGLSHTVSGYAIGAQPPTIVIQFVDSATGAAVELPNGLSFLFELSLKNSSAY